ncbi:hypothetical protein [Streptomyces sp. KL116D]|uniref:hypothetical protein n=1 Tax=Streptomyces sp. KL116D TaxID=3045152 RepID=UPI003557242C
MIPAPKRIAALAAGTTAGLGAIVGAAHATGAPAGVVAAAAGALVCGGVAVAEAVRTSRREAVR